MPSSPTGGIHVAWVRAYVIMGYGPEPGVESPTKMSVQKRPTAKQIQPTGLLGCLEAIQGTHHREGQERDEDHQFAEGAAGAGRFLRRKGEDVQQDAGQEHGHTETGERPRQPGGGTVTQPTDSSALLPCSFCHDVTLQHYRLASVTTTVTRRSAEETLKPIAM